MTVVLTNEIIQRTTMLPDFQKEDEIQVLIKQMTVLSLFDNYFVRGIYLDDRSIGFVNDVTITDIQIECKRQIMLIST